VLGVPSCPIVTDAAVGEALAANESATRDATSTKRFD
jgi:hypothetical protein